MMAMRTRGDLPAADPTGGAQIDQLLLDLEQNIESAKLSIQEVERLLSDVKVFGRNRDTSGPIFSKRGIEVLSKYGLDQKDPSTISSSREALRCLANAFLLNESCRQTFVDLGYAPKAAERMKVDNRDDEFLISRILFLLTYNTKLDFELLVENNHLVDSINLHLERHAKAFSTKSARRKSDAAPIQDMSLTETLKLTFNISHYYPGLVPKFTPSIEPIINLVLSHPLPTPPLKPPITYMLNALLNLDLGAASKKTPFGPQATSSPLFPYLCPEQVAERFTSIFNKAIVTMLEHELEHAAMPLCTLIRRQYELATSQMKEWMRWILLPRDSDRNRPLGVGDTMAARLLRLSCSPSLPKLSENISMLLFELSDQDAEKFVKNIGYGYASGFLMSHNIGLPPNGLEASSSSQEGHATIPAGVNPITGQRLSAENGERPQEPEMTQEEKEREAERLFVLFERLKATGVVDMKNPVQQAMEEGRFEEIE